MRWRILSLLVLAAAMAGCAGGDADTYELRGTFTEDASDEQRSELRQEVEDRDGSFAELESFPVQFHASGLTADECADVLLIAEEADDVREVGDCEREQASGGGEATSNGS